MKSCFMFFPILVFVFHSLCFLKGFSAAGLGLGSKTNPEIPESTVILFNNGWFSSY